MSSRPQDVDAAGVQTGVPHLSRAGPPSGEQDAPPPPVAATAEAAATLPTAAVAAMAAEAPGKDPLQLSHQQVVPSPHAFLMCYTRLVGPWLCSLETGQSTHKRSSW